MRARGAPVLGCHGADLAEMVVHGFNGIGSIQSFPYLSRKCQKWTSFGPSRAPPFGRARRLVGQVPFLCKSLKGKRRGWVVASRGRDVVVRAGHRGRAMRSSREADASRCGPRWLKKREGHGAVARQAEESSWVSSRVMSR